LAEYGRHVFQPQTIHANLDRLNHRTLDVLGVDHPVGTDAAGQLDREPAAPGAEISDDACFADAQRVHDLVRALPLVAIRLLEFAEILRLEQPGVLGERARLGHRQNDQRDRQCSNVFAAHRLSDLALQETSSPRPKGSLRAGDRKAAFVRAPGRESAGRTSLRPWRFWQSPHIQYKGSGRLRAQYFDRAARDTAPRRREYRQYSGRPARASRW